MNVTIEEIKPYRYCPSCEENIDVHPTAWSQCHGNACVARHSVALCAHGIAVIRRAKFIAANFDVRLVRSARRVPFELLCMSVSR